MRVAIIPILAFLNFFRYVDCQEAKSTSKEEQIKIAIIGGGVSGNFAAKYLSDYDTKCLFDITIFEAPPDNVNDQGSRVASSILKDGTIVELGASIIYDGNKLVNEMISGDENLEKDTPHSPGRELSNEEKSQLRKGMALFQGLEQEKKWAFNTANMASDEIISLFKYRYNIDLYKVRKATNQALESFNLIYDLLDSNHEATFFDSPNDIWRAVGLSHAASVSYDDYLDYLGVSRHVSWWKRIFGEQGILRSELHTAMNICNNNQLNSQMTGLAGLVNSAAAMGKLFSIKGGNNKLLQSAYNQAKQKHDVYCQRENIYGESMIRKEMKRIKTFVSNFDAGSELFDGDGKSIGTFDIVILASPLQFSGINFLGKGSMFDSSVLHSISLNEMVDSENSDANEHGHKAALGSHLPSSATRSYTQVVTTVISNAKLNHSEISLEKDQIPRSILFTEAGRESLGISSIGQISSDVYKIFSSEELSRDTVSKLFGSEAKVDIVKIWGGKNGGATPAFNGAGEASFSTRFKLYDGGHGASSYAEGAALYYTNAMESAVSAIEISAIGAKMVAKLVARQFDLIPSQSVSQSDEL